MIQPNLGRKDSNVKCGGIMKFACTWAILRKANAYVIVKLLVINISYEEYVVETKVLKHDEFYLPRMEIML